MKKNKKRQINPAGTAPEKPVPAPGETNAQVIEDRIRQRAYEIHHARGGTPGQELDDWLQAEREIKAVRNQA